MSKPAFTIPVSRARQRKVLLWARRAAEVNAQKGKTREQIVDLESWARAFSEGVKLVDQRP